MLARATDRSICAWPPLSLCVQAWPRRVDFVRPLRSVCARLPLVSDVLPPTRVPVLRGAGARLSRAVGVRLARADGVQPRLSLFASERLLRAVGERLLPAPGGGVRFPGVRGPG